MVAKRRKRLLLYGGMNQTSGNPLPKAETSSRPHLFSLAESFSEFFGRIGSLHVFEWAHTHKKCARGVVRGGGQSDKAAGSRRARGMRVSDGRMPFAPIHPAKGEVTHDEMYRRDVQAHTDV